MRPRSELGDAEAERMCLIWYWKEKCFAEQEHHKTYSGTLMSLAKY